MKTILITGINGYLGSHLAKALVSDFQIVGLEYKSENLFRIENLDIKVYSVEHGIQDIIFTEQHVDTIIHTATFYGRNNEDMNQLFISNLVSPFMLLEKAIKYDCKLFMNTDTVLDRFVSIYALTKHQFYEWLWMLRRSIKIANMQLEHFYGPNGSNSNFISAMTNKLKNNEPIIDLTAGEQLRDFVYIDDVVNAYKTVLDNVTSLKEDYSSFQVASGTLSTIKYLMQLLKDITGSQSILNFGAIPYRENELMQSNADNSALLQLGWKPRYTLAEGLLKII